MINNKNDRKNLVLVSVVSLIVLCLFIYVLINSDKVSINDEQVQQLSSEEEGIHLSECGILNQINTTYYLDEDVMGDGGCFVVNAESVILDCKGHSILNVGIMENSSGVISEKQDFTEVKNCLINGFQRGVYYKGNSEGKIINNILEDNQEGIYLWVTNNIEVKENEAINNKDFGISLRLAKEGIIEKNKVGGGGYGIYLSNSNNNKISLNEGYENIWYGIYLFESSENDLIDNKFCLNGHTDIRVDKGEIVNGVNNLCSSVFNFNDLGLEGCSLIC